MKSAHCTRARGQLQARTAIALGARGALGATLVGLVIVACGETSSSDPGASPADPGAIDASPGDAASVDGGPAPDAATTSDGTSPEGGRPSVGDKDAKGRTLVWADEFDGASIDRAAWGNEVGVSIRNNELESYTVDAKNQFVDKGDLVIKAIYESGSGAGSYTSASLTTEGHKSLLYGRIEARIKIPGAKGSWPAFWLLPANKAKYDHNPPYNSWWPAGGEIDVLESVSQDPATVYGTAHYLLGGVHQSSGATEVMPAPLAGDYHVFAIEWTATTIDWFVDAKKYHSFDISKAFDGRTPFNDPFYLILNLAVGGSWPEAPSSAQYPCEMRVDWVRVWQAI